jgi:hypothetical protein
MNGDDAIEVVREAERNLYHAQWRVWEELALEQLACSRGLARAPLVPGSDAIQLVAYDGEHLGHVRRDGQCPPGECWVAVAVKEARPCGRYGSAEAAARGLGRACGKADGTGQ